MNVGLLTRAPTEGSAARLQEAFAERGHRVKCIDTSLVTIELEESKLTLRHEGSPLPPFDIVLARIGHQSTTQGLNVLEQLELMQYPVTPRASALRLSRNKLLALQRLAASGLLVPRTAFVSDATQLGPAIARLGGAPLIVKVLEGAKGRGVMLAESNQSAHAIADAFLAMNEPVLIQTFIEESRGRDIRLLVVGDEVAAAVRRQARGDEYRSNVYLGAEAERIEPPPEFVRAALQAARALGLEIAGVDILESRRGPVVLEVNSSPGIAGMETSTGMDLADIIVRFVVRHFGKSQHAAD